MADFNTVMEDIRNDYAQVVEALDSVKSRLSQIQGDLKEIRESIDSIVIEEASPDSEGSEGQ